MNTTLNPPPGFLAPLLKTDKEGHTYLGLDGSALEEFMRCPRAFLFKHFYKRVKANEKSDLTFGRYCHRALEFGREHVDRVLEECYSTGPLPEDDFRTLARAKELMHAYYEGYIWGTPGTAGHYEHPGYKEENWRVLSTEKDFSRPLASYVNPGPYSLEVRWEGVKDRVVEASDGLWVVDAKTCKEFNQETYWRAYGGAHTAMLGYCWDAFHEYGRLPQGYIIDVLCCRKPLQRPTAASAPRNQFERRAFRLKEGDLERWERNTLAVIRNLLACVESGYYSQHDRKGFNCAWCEYADICAQPDDRSALNLLGSGEFRDYTWTPQKRDEQ